MRSMILTAAGIFAVLAIFTMGSGDQSKAEVAKTKERIWSVVEQQG